MQTTLEKIQTKGGEGSGDIVWSLNLAHAWSALNDAPVELEVHWPEKSEFLYHPDDQETIQARWQLMHEKYFESHRVYCHHVYDSQLFADCWNMTDQEERRRLKPKRLHFHTNAKVPRDFDWNMPFAEIGCASWRWKESRQPENKIIFWTPKDNREEVKDYKRAGDLTLENWYIVKHELTRRFPDHEIVELTYRDSFIKAYEEIKKAKFCLGYDGMWHMVARNFGVPMITCTKAQELANCYTPHAKVFTNMISLIEHIQTVTDDQIVHLQEQVEKRHQDHLRQFRCGI